MQGFFDGTREMVVEKVDEKDGEVLLYGQDLNYHIHSAIKDNVKVGDRIRYKSLGLNSGEFLEKI
jgi:hypothetical protein